MYVCLSIYIYAFLCTYVSAFYYYSGSPPFTEDDCKNDYRKTNCRDYFGIFYDDLEDK